MKTKFILIKFYEKSPGLMEGKITSNSKTNQTSLSTRDHNFANGELLGVLTASNCKSIYSKYINICLKLAFVYFFSLWLWYVFLLKFVQFILKLSFKKNLDLVNIIQFSVESSNVAFFVWKKNMRFYRK